MTLKDCLAIACIGLWILVFPPQALACDCTFYAIEALSKVGIHLKTIPSVVVNDFHRYPGAYANGVVAVKDNRDCRVMTHEFYHKYQAEKLGELDEANQSEWFKRERDAAIVTMYATEMRGDCK